MFSFRPITETDQQLEQMRFKLLEPDTYDFVVEKATSEVSKSGNQMIKLVLKIWDKEGREVTIFDYLVDIDYMRYKIKHFCEAVGLSDKLAAGSFNESDCEGKGGKAVIVIQKSKKYGDRNSVSDYLVSTVAKNDEPFFDDDLQFLK